MPFLPVQHEKTQRLGYNLGFNKGTFATAFDRKEYFESHIRPQNRRDLTPGIVNNKHARNNATFIEYDKKKREDFEVTVQRYLDTINKEEKEEREKRRREEQFIAQMEEDDQSVQASQLNTVSKQSARNVHEKERRQFRAADTIEEIKMPVKKQKKIPNYMKPNAAWLGRNDTGA